MTLDADPASTNSPEHPQQMSSLKRSFQHIIGPKNQVVRKCVKAQQHQTTKNDTLARPLAVSLMCSHTCKNTGGWGVSIHDYCYPTLASPKLPRSGGKKLRLPSRYPHSSRSLCTCPTINSIVSNLVHALCAKHPGWEPALHTAEASVYGSKSK